MKLSYALFRRGLLVLALFCIHAAAAGDEGEARGSDGAVAPAARKPGYFVGDFRVRPSISVTQEYDNNIFSTERHEVSDWILQVSPLVKAESTDATHSVQIEAGADKGLYGEYTDENYLDYHGIVDAQSSVTATTSLYAGLGFRAAHESRDSPDAQVGALEPTRYQSTDANIGLTTRQGDVTYRLGLTWEMLDFDDTPSAGGEIINDDRDRQLLGSGLRTALQVTGEARVFAQAFYDKRDYDLPTDQNGYRRDSSGYRAALGIALESTGENEGEAYVGLIHQRYADHRFDDVHEIDFGVRLAVTPTPQSKVTLELQRSLNETTDPGSSGYLNTALAGRLEYRISPRLIPYVGLNYDADDYFGTARYEETFSAAVGAKYFLTPNTYLVAGVRHANRDSDDAGAPADSTAFDRTVAFVNFTALLYPLQSN